MIRHLIVIISATAVAVLAGTTLSAHRLDSGQAQGQTPAPVPVTFNISVRGLRVGQENVTLTRTADGWLISATGSQGAPANFTIDKFEALYTPDWQPRSLIVEARSGGQSAQLMTMATTFSGTTATNDLLQSGKKSQTSLTVHPQTVVLPNNFFGAYEALAARLATSQTGAVIPVYVAPQAEISAVVGPVTSQRVQTPDTVVELRHFSLSMKNPGGAVGVDVSIDAKGRLARVSVPSAGIVALRRDLSSVMTRDVSYQNDADKMVFIPALGFTIAATTTTPAAVKASDRLPAVVLVGGTGPADRDELAFGIPMFGQLSGQLANAGFFVVRYDKRGVGQSGGRPESATLQDYADDAVSVVGWLRQRKDIDPKRIAIVGYSDGGAVALLAGDRAGDKVAAIGLVGAPGHTGREIVLARQERTLSRATNPADEKRAMVAMQTRILDAAVSGNWTGIPPAAQRAADTLLFKSWVEFDPAAAMKRVDQPILIVHGTLDTEMTPDNADRLEALAAARKAKAAALTKKVMLPGEYSSIADKTISPAVAASIADWLRVVMVKK